jgi:hypothetical protein
VYLQSVAAVLDDIGIDKARHDSLLQKSLRQTPHKVGGIRRSNGKRAWHSCELCYRRKRGSGFLVVFVEYGLKPVGAVGDPPSGHEAGNRCSDGPPEGQGEVDDEAEGGEGQPKNFALHEFSLAERVRTGATANNECVQLRSEQNEKGRSTRPFHFSKMNFDWFSESRAGNPAAFASEPLAERLAEQRPLFRGHAPALRPACGHR